MRSSTASRIAVDARWLASAASVARAWARAVAQHPNRRPLTELRLGDARLGHPLEALDHVPHVHRARPRPSPSTRRTRRLNRHRPAHGRVGHGTVGSDREARFDHGRGHPCRPLAREQPEVAPVARREGIDGARQELIEARPRAERRDGRARLRLRGEDEVTQVHALVTDRGVGVVAEVAGEVVVVGAPLGEGHARVGADERVDERPRGLGRREPARLRLLREEGVVHQLAEDRAEVVTREPRPHPLDARHRDIARREHRVADARHDEPRVVHREGALDAHVVAVMVVAAYPSVVLRARDRADEQRGEREGGGRWTHAAARG
jgi:hypothetical protein